MVGTGTEATLGGATCYDGEMPRERNRPALILPSPPALEAPDDFAGRLAALGIDLPAERVQKLGDYLARLLAMNERMNLTRITDPADAWERHLLDALTLVPHLSDLPAGASILDVGSGGGVPGIPLAIARPDLKVSLLEATQKKVAFLAAVAAALGLDQVTALAGRAEDLAESALRGRFAIVTARAVANLAALLPWTAPFAQPGGRLLLIKGERADQELADARDTLHRFGCTHEQTERTPTGRIVVLRVGVLRP